MPYYQHFRARILSRDRCDLRPVQVDACELTNNTITNLEIISRAGCLAVGDVIEYEKGLWLAAPSAWIELTPEDYAKLEQQFTESPNGIPCAEQNP